MHDSLPKRGPASARSVLARRPLIGAAPSPAVRPALTLRDRIDLRLETVQSDGRSAQLTGTCALTLRLAALPEPLAPRPLLMGEWRQFGVEALVVLPELTGPDGAVGLLGVGELSTPLGARVATLALALAFEDRDLRAWTLALSVRPDQRPGGLPMAEVTLHPGTTLDRRPWQAWDRPAVAKGRTELPMAKVLADMALALQPPSPPTPVQAPGLVQRLLRRWVLGL